MLLGKHITLASISLRIARIASKKRTELQNYTDTQTKLYSSYKSSCYY